MKNRFYGDINDYIKYGILDILSNEYKSLGINWYLTDDKHGNQKHGNKTRYLDDDKWKNYHPRIFSLLKSRLKKQQRDISNCGTDSVINFKCEFCDQLPDNATRNNYSQLRNQWHTKAVGHFKECDLMFFDPDIGITDQSSRGPVKNSEYCLATELEDYSWCDWLVVQFLQRRRRYDQLRANPILNVAKRRDKKVMVFIYSQMALLYASDKIRSSVMHSIFQRWDTRVDTKVLVP
jgi:hypothetical protein